MPTKKGKNTTEEKNPITMNMNDVLSIVIVWYCSFNIFFFASKPNKY